MEDKFNKLLKNHTLTRDLNCSPCIEKIKYNLKLDKIEIKIKDVDGEKDKNIIKNFFRDILPTLSNIEISYREEVTNNNSNAVDIIKTLINFFNKKEIYLNSSDIYTIADSVSIYCNNDNFKKLSSIGNIKEETINYLKNLNCNGYENIIFNEIEEDISEKHLSMIKSKETKITKKVVSQINQNTEKTVVEQDTDKKERFGKKITNSVTPIKDLGDSWDYLCVAGEVIDLNKVVTKKGDYVILTYDISDYTSTVTCKTFFTTKKFEEYEHLIKIGGAIKVEGKYSYDNFARTNVINVSSIEPCTIAKKKDNAIKKRVELHLYTQMSALDGFVKVNELMDILKEWGHTAIGITDKGVVQAYPDVDQMARSKGIKPLYGLEAKFLKNNIRILTDYYSTYNDNEFVVFDIETTGFSKINNKIIEIGAVKIKNREIVENYNQLINPEVFIPEEIIELTGIDNNMVKNEPVIEKVLQEFMNFVGDSTLIAHNADFDIGFIRENCKRQNIEFKNAFIDTVTLSRAAFPELKRHKLNLVAKHLNISLENHHRACDDAKATAEIFLETLKRLADKGINFNENINDLETDWPLYKNESFNGLIYTKNLVGLKNLYKIVSESSLNYFNKSPGIPEFLLENHKKGLIIGSGNQEGELFKAILDDIPEFKIEEIARKFDFLEVQPPENYGNLVFNGKIKDNEEVKNIISRIVNLGEKLNIPVVATGDVHYIYPDNYLLRNIVQTAQPMGRKEYKPVLYLRTTDEMLNSFSFLGNKKSKEIVIENTNNIKDMLEEFKPIPDGTFPPVIEGSDKELKDITYNKAISLYGDPLPEIVKQRLDRELTSIISNGYAVLYIIAQKLVWKSNDDGYLVGSRGSVGSSFAATMAGITEVNPLLPHYRCPECKQSEFIDDMNVGSGIDMPDKKCPVCGSDYVKDGHNIPFEVFLGFEGDKEPDIDLNFAGEYQPIVHKYTEELFGHDKVFRAGTIGTIADNTAYGYIQKFLEENNENIPAAELKRLQRGIVGIKRTSGQHPGGVMIVPQDKEIYDFCPVQHPADDMNSSIITTHFNYHSISGRILKLDLLGHDVPSIIKMLSDITGIDPLSIPLDDEDTMSIFRSTEKLNFVEDYDYSTIGTLGIPEFGTKFVRQMLVETLPTTFSELVRISGLSHGTDVWTNNAQELVKNNIASLKEVICTRDDIMTYLIQKGLENKRSFKIMETVRKGRLLDEETENYMRENNVPEWYIDSCRKIQYMFPKAHAVAYSLMSYRIAYFKVHYPEAFYSTFFTTKIADYPGQTIYSGIEAIRTRMKEIKELGYGASAKDNSILTVLEVAEEMYCRGIKSSKITFKDSDELKFKVLEKGCIQPPFRALEGVSDAHSIAIYKEYHENDFLSIQDLTKRTKINKGAVEALKIHGVLEGLPDSNQLSFL
ncbi:PolC-type DNA polymerase III [Miniphocaeibacter massiliensis]|uniref:PolC-type DNA polymerase III n=1 Tax=Miniphocaeibacter massiliensis TaxID=2041841 RepID=UPI000C06E721|nr:PolC-type DNA polymerase III [Miniphocaeibacter massiliensis]